MIHLAAFLLCLAGFAALAVATRRQQRDLFGKRLSLSTTYGLRVAGACILVLALSLLVGRYGWGLALVMFSGHTSIVAGVVFGLLIGYARTYARKSARRAA